MVAQNSKLIAEYLGWKYIPHNDLQGFHRAGWFKTDNSVRAMLAKHGGWVKHPDGFACRFICRNHSELRFYNSMDALLPTIEKLEKEYNLKFNLYNNGAEFEESNIKIGYSFNENQTWVQNTFDVVVKAIKKIEYEKI